MFAAILLVAYLVQPGDTLSGIAASHGVSLAAVEGANPRISDPNLIYSGQKIEIPRGSSASQGSHVRHSHAAADHARQGKPEQQRALSRDASSSSLSDIPGVPQSFAACVAYRESTDLRNPAAHGNAYGIIASSGYHVSGRSLAYQKQVFTELYRDYGGKPWVADGCPGT